MGTFTALIDQLDPVNKKRRGDQGEAVGKFLLQNDPVLSREFTKVWLWKEWPYYSPTGTQWRWKEQEAGIDLVAQRHDDSLCAVQVKAYQKGGTVPRNEIAKFLAESARPVFKDRLLITTADHVAPHAADAATSGKGMVVVPGRRTDELAGFPIRPACSETEAEEALAACA